VTCRFHFDDEASAQDLDGDGHVDLIAVDSGVPPYEGSDPDCGVWAISAATGEVLWQRIERWSDHQDYVTGYGQGLALTADIDRDGLKDLVVGSWSETWFDVIEALSARTGSRLWRVEACDAALGLYAVDDCNGDGLSDLVVPRWTDQEGRPLEDCVYSSADGSLLFFAPPGAFPH
jgi:outer membrane protein assembly factor BamB